MIFWYLLAVVLVLRLFLFLNDQPQRVGRFAVVCALHLVTLGLLKVDSDFFVFGGILVLTWLMHWLVERADKRLLCWRMISVVWWGLLLSFATSEKFGLEFAPWLAKGLERAAQYSSLLQFLSGLDWNVVLRHSCGLLLCMNEVNLPIRYLIDRLNLKPKIAGSEDIAEDEYNRGRVIGILERLFAYFFAFNGAYTAFGALLAAKGIARWPGRNEANRDFIEYILIGTLLSFMAAGMIALAMRVSPVG